MENKKHKGGVFLSKYAVLNIVAIIFLFLLCFLVPILYGGTPNAVRFSKKTGFYTDDINVEFSYDRMIDSLSGYRIRYTTDGDSVNNNSIDGGDSLHLVAPDSGYSVYTIKAALCNDSGGCNKTSYATYVLGKDLNESINIGIASIVAPYDYLYNYDYGIMVPGRVYDENFEIDPNRYIYGNYHERGKDWERAAHISMFDKDGNSLYDDDVNIAISGDSSSAMDVKSLKVISKDSSRAPITAFGGRYESVKLRSGSQDQKQGNIRSSVVSRLSKESRYKGCSETERVVLFLNNEFYGIFDLQQPFSASFFSNVYHIKQPKLVEKYKGLEKDILKEAGIEDLFNHSWSEENMKKLEEAIDIDDYLTYFALQVLWNNTDWPIGNFGMWRYNGSTYASDGPNDGRFRFYIYDTDLVYYSSENIQYYDGADGDIFVDVMDSRKHASNNYFVKVIKADRYKDKFINILRELINGPFKTENVLRIIDEEAAKIQNQMQLFYSEEEYENWVKMVEVMREAASKREGEVRADVKNYFGVDL